MIARLEVTRGSLTEYPLAEKVRGGWQNGVTFYADDDVTKITPLRVSPEPQGNPSDARVEAVAKALYESTWANGEYAKTSEFNKDSWRRHARAALRAAGGVR